MAYATQTSQIQGALASRLRSVLDTLQTRMERRRVYKRTLHELQALSNRELADLGLNRSMLNRVAYQAAHEV